MVFILVQKASSLVMPASGLRRGTSRGESENEDQPAHLQSPLFDKRRLEKRFDR